MLLAPTWGVCPLLIERYQTIRDGIFCEVGDRMKIQFFHDDLPVPFDGFDAEERFCRDFFIARPLTRFVYCIIAVHFCNERVGTKNRTLTIEAVYMAPALKIFTTGEKTTRQFWQGLPRSKKGGYSGRV